MNRYGIETAVAVFILGYFTVSLLGFEVIAMIWRAF